MKYQGCLEGVEGYLSGGFIVYSAFRGRLEDSLLGALGRLLCRQKLHDHLQDPANQFLAYASIYPTSDEIASARLESGTVRLQKNMYSDLIYTIYEH